MGRLCAAIEPFGRMATIAGAAEAQQNTVVRRRA
jgi:hypothetical protein